MSRSVKKGIYINKKIFDKVCKIKSDPNIKTIVIKVMQKNFIIIPEYVGILFKVYNGHKFQDIKIQEEMIGYRLGEFITTRKLGKHVFVTKKSRQKVK